MRVQVSRSKMGPIHDTFTVSSQSLHNHVREIGPLGPGLANRPATGESRERRAAQEMVSSSGKSHSAWHCGHFPGCPALWEANLSFLWHLRHRMCM